MPDETPQHLRRTVPLVKTSPASRGYLFAYTIWNKADMVPLIFGSVLDSFGPEDAGLLFVFDSPEDDAPGMYHRYRVNAAYGYQCGAIVNERDEWYESGSHNAAIGYFLGSPLYHTLVVFQDDQRLRPGNQLLDHLDRLRGEYGQTLGVISGREGWEPGGREIVSGPSSGSNVDSMKIPVGAFQARTLQNRGPIVYPRHVVERVGSLDLSRFRIWHAEVDYSYRAAQCGFVNGVLGMDLAHRAIGKVTASRTYQGQEAADRERLYEKHGRRDLLP